MSTRGIIMAVSLLSSFFYARAEEDLKIAVISDIHLMAPSLLKQDGTAMDDYIANDRKLLRESPVLMKEAMDTILAARPDILLISGDLTKDGETISHLFLRDNYLAKMKAEGIRIFVIPGNHDINNPHAVEFDGDKTTRVPTPSAAEFAEIYAGYGYGEALARDSHSLSYVVQLNAKTRLLCLDSCLYGKNDMKKNLCVTEGGINRHTRKFIRQQAAEARKNGERLIAMMHHGVVRHWKWQEVFMGMYLVNNWRSVSRLLWKSGVDVVFTGHFHAQDISCKGKVVDIETGSIISYPAPMRFVTLSGDRMYVRSTVLSGKGLEFPDGRSFEDIMLEYADGAMRSIVNMVIPEKVDPKLTDHCSTVLAKCYIAHLRGDETLTEADRAEIDEAVSKLGEQTWFFSKVMNLVGKSFMNDLPPADLNVEIDLRPVKSR